MTKMYVGVNHALKAMMHGIVLIVANGFRLLKTMYGLKIPMNMFVRGAVKITIFVTVATVALAMLLNMMIISIALNALRN